MNWIREKYWAPINGGTFHGVVTFHINFSGEEPERNGIINLIMEMQNGGEFFKAGFKNVSLEGEFPGNDTMLTLVRTLKDLDCKIRVISDGQFYRSWFAGSNSGEKLIDWLVVEVGREPWPGFNVEEFRYHLSDEDYIPIMPSRYQAAYLVVNSKIKLSSVAEFAKKSKVSWNVFYSVEEEMRKDE